MKPVCLIPLILVYVRGSEIVRRTYKEPLTQNDFRNSHFVGGWTSNLGENEVVDCQSGQSENCEVARKSLQLLDNEMNSINPSKLHKMCQVKTQVVAGTNYMFDLLVRDSGTGKIRSCHLKVYKTLPYAGSELSLTDHSCTDGEACGSPARKKRSLLGAEEDTPKDAEGVQEAARWAVAHINSMSNAMFMQTLLRVSKVSTQVVSGLKYTMQLTTAPTSCRNHPDNVGKSLNKCPLTSQGHGKDCKVVVVFSLGKYQMEDYKCDLSKNYPTLIGGTHDEGSSQEKPLLGKDGHGQWIHNTETPKEKHLLGENGHGQWKHFGETYKEKPLLGRDGHGQWNQNNDAPKDKHLFGENGHGQRVQVNDAPKQKHLLGENGHGQWKHFGIANEKPLLGKDGHGQWNQNNDAPKEKHLLGENGHGQWKHFGDVEKPLLGKDGHGQWNQNIEAPKEKHLLGENGHGQWKHFGDEEKSLLGQGGHGQWNQGINMQGLLGRDGHGQWKHQENSQLIFGSGHLNGVQRMSIEGNLNPFAQVAPECEEFADQFKKFKVTHRKLYGGVEEEARRFSVFCKNMQKVKEIQTQERGTATYGATMFADLSEEEFRGQYLGLHKTPSSVSWPLADIPKGPIPSEWDWRDHNAVTPVKNQGSCGSCWAFSTTGNVEGQWAIKKNKLLELSEQELVDCDKVDEGCNGGLPSQAYEAIMKLGGLETEQQYSYEGQDDKCRFNKAKVEVKVTGAVNISSDEADMAAWLYKNGPISIGINAFAMQFYFGGIAHPWKLFCNPKELDHGVLIVGYGVEGTKPYWIVKNSWGPSWGRDGYYYVYRGDGTCGLNNMCTSATVE